MPHYAFPSERLLPKKKQWKVWVGGITLGVVVGSFVTWLVMAQFIINHFN